MQATHNSGSAYFNYKKKYSVELRAVCNAMYEFTMTDSGDPGRQSDGRVYINSHLGFAIENTFVCFLIRKIFIKKWASKTPKPSENVKEISRLKCLSCKFKNADFWVKFSIFSYLKSFSVFIINDSTILFSNHGKIKRWKGYCYC